MAVCKFNSSASSDMFGLGIRLGYYFQWFGAILASWIAPSEVKSIRFGIDLFVAATFLALIILTANDVNSLEPVETYIILLLMFGTYFALVPIYLWRLLTGCDPYLDPTRYPLVNLGALSANLSLIMLTGVLSFQYWFWFNRVPDLDHYNCQEYGFLFSRVRLNSKVSVVLNVLMYSFLSLVCLYILLLKIGHALGFPDPGEFREKRVIRRRSTEAHIRLLQNLDACIKLMVAIVVTVAVELTISWNEIGDVDTLSGAGQTIPFIIGIGCLVRILYVYLFYGDHDGNEGGGLHARGPPAPVSAVQLPSTRIWEPPFPAPIPVRQIPEAAEISLADSREADT